MSPPGPHPRLTPEALAALYAHARREYPKECCGIVFGPADADVADEARECRNVQDDLHAEDPEAHPRDAATAYNLGAKDLFALQKSLRGERPAKIIYHSHVDVGAYFSPTDQEAALFADEPAYPVEYVVIDAQKDGCRRATQFAWDPDVKKFVEVDRYQEATG